MTGSPKASTTVDAPYTISAHRGFELREQAPQSTVSRTQESTLENVHPPDIHSFIPSSYSSPPQAAQGIGLLSARGSSSLLLLPHTFSSSWLGSSAALRINLLLHSSPQSQLLQEASTYSTVGSCTGCSGDWGCSSSDSETQTQLQHALLLHTLQGNLCCGS